MKPIYPHQGTVVNGEMFYFKILVNLLLMWAIPITSYADNVITLTAPAHIAHFFHNQDKTGFLDELLSLTFERLGYELDVVTYPPERSLKMAESGLVDGELLRTRSIENRYPSLVRVKEAIAEVEFVVFSFRPIDLSGGWESLAGKSVGLVIGMKIIEERVPETASVTRVRSAEQLFEMLKSERVDYVVFARVMGQDYLTKSPIPNILVSDQSLSSVPVFTYLHPKHTNLATQLAFSLKEMKQKSTYQRILDKHKRSWERKLDYPFSEHDIGSKDSREIVKP